VGGQARDLGGRGLRRGYGPPRLPRVDE
jgi:hypothetical protein